MSPNQDARITAAAATAMLLLAGTISSSGQPQAQRDFTKELANKLRGTYTVAALGGLLARGPAVQQISAELQQVIQSANTAVGHVEFYQADRSNAGLALPAKEFVQGLSAVGLDLVGVSDTEGGEEALRTVNESMGAFGLALARPDWQPVYQNVPAGRIAMLGGPHPIRLSTAKYVTAEQFAQLKAIQASIVARRTEPDVSRPIGIPSEPQNQVTIFADTYLLGPVAGEIKEEPSASDRQNNVMAVRSTKEFADFVVFSMPLPPAPKGGHYSDDHKPHEQTVSLAHELVENGMDLYVGHGNHVLQGIEIYKGRPIFYNLGDLSAHRPFGPPDSLKAVIPTMRYQDGVLQEVRLYPVDLGAEPAERPASRVGIAMTPSPEAARRLIADLQKYSEPFGTKIAFENGTGVIRVPRDATQTVGQNIHDFGTAPRPGAAGGRGRGGRGRGGL